MHGELGLARAAARSGSSRLCRLLGRKARHPRTILLGVLGHRCRDTPPSRFFCVFVSVAVLCLHAAPSFTIEPPRVPPLTLAFGPAVHLEKVGENNNRNSNDNNDNNDRALGTAVPEALPCTRSPLAVHYPQIYSIHNIVATARKQKRVRSV